MARKYLCKSDENRLIEIYQTIVNYNRMSPSDRNDFIHICNYHKPLTNLNMVKDSIFKMIQDNNMDFSVGQCRFKYDHDSMIQDLSVVIFKSMLTFELNRNVSFRTHLGFNLMGFRSLKNKKLFRDEKYIPLDIKFHYCSSDSHSDLLGDLEHAITLLSDIDRKNLHIYEESDFNFRIMSDNLNVSHQRCHQMMQQVFSKIKFYIQNPYKKISINEKLRLMGYFN